MKFWLLFIFALLFTLTSSAQTEPEEVVLLSSKLTKGQQVVKPEFSNVPDKVRDCHARGAFVVRVDVDVEGNVTGAKLISGLCKDADDYVEKTVAGWKFKVLEIDGEATPFKATVQIFFCYGSFGACDW